MALYILTSLFVGLSIGRALMTEGVSSKATGVIALILWIVYSSLANQHLFV